MTISGFGVTDPLSTDVARRRPIRGLISTVARISDIVLLRKIKIRGDLLFCEYHLHYRIPIIFSNRFVKIDYAFFPVRVGY